MADRRVPGTRPDQREYRDYPVFPSLTDWDVALVRRTLNQLELGSFTLAAQLFEQMQRDDRIGAVLDTRVSALHGLPLSFEPEREGRLAAPLVRDLEDNWYRWFPEATIRDWQQWAMGLGVSVAEILWDQGDRWTPRLKVWHPSLISWRWDIRRWQVQTADGPVIVNPGDGKWAILSYGDRRPWMHGLVRRLAIPWLIRQYAWRDWARYSEVHGLPIRKGKVPASAKEEDKQQFLRDLAALGNESTIRLPQGADKDTPGFDVELIEAAARSWEGFQALLVEASTSIAVSVLGQNLTTEMRRGGSYAAAKVHAGIRQDLLRTDAELLSTAMHEQVLCYWAGFNYARPAPWPRWATKPAEERKAESDRFKSTIDALAQARSAGLPIDERAVLDQAGIPLLKPGEIPPRTPQNQSPLEDDDDPEALSRVRLASGGNPRRARGFIEGQLYADLVADRTGGRMIEAVRPDLQDLQGIIEGAEDYEDLRRKLLEIYQDMSPEALSALMERALILAELGGHLAVLQDL